MTVSGWRLSISPVVREWWMVLLAMLLACIGLWGMFARRSDGDGEVRSLRERVVRLEDAQAKLARDQATELQMLHEWEEHGTVAERGVLDNVLAMRQELHRWQAERKK